MWLNVITANIYRNIIHVYHQADKPYAINYHHNPYTFRCIPLELNDVDVLFVCIHAEVLINYYRSVL